MNAGGLLFGASSRIVRKVYQIMGTVHRHRPHTGLYIVNVLPEGRVRAHVTRVSTTLRRQLGNGSYAFVGLTPRLARGSKAVSRSLFHSKLRPGTRKCGHVTGILGNCLWAGSSVLGGCTSSPLGYRYVFPRSSGNVCSFSS